MKQKPQTFCESVSKCIRCPVPLRLFIFGQYFLMPFCSIRDIY
ncbi:hypothetical protein AC094_33910 [Bacteroides fragilis]|uniref:Uncharacterized protein n=1 Tax=Bacteroides fragilis TaxID=817 RepID=A0A853PNS0_BACFG|nr:hypothetical protein AC094_33910 [Bacteroides fragilis]OCR33399.1 hypothetical protein AC141_35100 [Bacteroides fragilis]